MTDRPHASSRRIGRLVATLMGAASLSCSDPDAQTSPHAAPSSEAAPSSAVAADPGIRRADSLVAAWVEAERVPGAVLMVSRDGETAFRKAHGQAQIYDYGTGQYPEMQDASGPGIERLERPRPMPEGTLFDLASVTKVMATTFAVMLLVDRGALDLDAPLYTVLEDFRGPEKDRVTLRHLLTHRAGLRQWVPTYYHASTPDEAHDYIRDLPLGWAVGEGRRYSDLGFMLLGWVVEEVTGTSLDAFLRAELYGPLGLEHTGFGGSDALSGPFAATSHGNPFERRMVHDTAFGYRIEGDADAWNGWRTHTLVGEVNDGNAHHAFGGQAGHAGLFSTADDLVVLLELLLEGGTHEGRRFLSPDVVASFLAPTGDGQALGWQTPDYLPPSSFAHTGFTGTFVFGVREQGLAVVLLTNRQNVGVDEDTRYPDVGPLQREVAAALTGG
jgi:CubicO group peptidase (beta-lactamase class C family)